MAAGEAWKTGRQMLLLLAVSAAAAIAARTFHEQPLDLTYPWSRHVENSAREKGLGIAAIEEVQAMAESFSHVILDARRQADYLAGHLPGALSLPADDFEAHFPSVAPLMTPEQPVLVYCSGEDCDDSILLGETLRRSGFTNVSLFVGGIKAWKDAGLPVAR